MTHTWSQARLTFFCEIHESYYYYTLFAILLQIWSFSMYALQMLYPFSYRILFSIAKRIITVAIRKIMTLANDQSVIINYVNCGGKNNFAELSDYSITGLHKCSHLN